MPYPNYAQCTGCDLKKETKTYFNTEFQPKEGVRESVLQLNFCSKCETYTRWFMGRGAIKVPNKYFDFEMPPWKWTLSRLQSIHNEEESRKKCLTGRGGNESTNPLLRLINAVKLMFFKKKLDRLDSDIKSLQEALLESTKNILFFETVNPNPKCMECGYDKVYDHPKHICGGDIVFVTDYDIHYNPFFETSWIYLYDEMGLVNKKFVGRRFELRS